MVQGGLPPPEQIGAFLGQVALFKNVKRDFLVQIAERVEPRVFNPGETIFDEGDAGDALYIIRSGAVGVYLVDKAIGLEFEIARLRSGQVFGEMAVVSEEKRSATCKALEPTACFLLQREVFLRIVEKIPQVAMSMAQVLAARVNQLNRERGAQMIDVSKIEIDPPTYRLVPSHILNRLKMIPLHIRNGKLTLACVDVNNLGGIDEIRRIIRGVEIRPIGITEADYQQVVERHRASQPKDQGTGQFVTKIKAIRWLSEEGDEKVDTSQAEEVKALVDRIVAEGIEREASDVHIEPQRDGVVVRYRVNGRLTLREGRPIPKAIHRIMTSRIKILSQLDISERRLPQDGRMSLEAAGRNLDLRVSTLPSQDGEKIVLRILDSQNALMPLERLILADKVCRVVQQLVMRPHGVVYVCGPTGSGKTTTLYSAIGVRRQVDTNITTVEDPVEYYIPGITQVNVKPDIGLNFAKVLRATLRQDPNVILVGETRDQETGKLVLEAGLTGHMVLTSLHTNDAIGTIQRLREMDLENFAISASLVGVISQRLVRRICPACAVDVPIAPHVRDQLALANVVPQDFKGTVKQPKGCNVCSGAGFRGRVGVYEILVADDRLRERIAANAPVNELRTVATSGAYVPLARYSNYLLTNGVTAPEELLAINVPQG